MNKTEIFKTELNYIKNDRIKRSADHGGRKPGISSVFEYGAWYDL